MKKLNHCYEVVSVDGSHYYFDALAAIQHAAFMESVGADSVFYLCYKYDGRVKRIRRMSTQSIIRKLEW